MTFMAQLDWMNEFSVWTNNDREMVQRMCIARTFFIPYFWQIYKRKNMLLCIFVYSEKKIWQLYYYE